MIFLMRDMRKARRVKAYDRRNTQTGQVIHVGEHIDLREAAVHKEMSQITKLAHFLQDKTGDATGVWTGRMSVAEQKDIFGAYRFGKQLIQINGSKEVVKTKRTVSFGQDADIQEYPWAKL